MITNILLGCILLTQFLTAVGIGGIGVELEGIKNNVAAIRSRVFEIYLNTTEHEYEK